MEPKPKENPLEFQPDRKSKHSKMTSILSFIREKYCHSFLSQTNVEVAI